jgi:predicted XRE-type DNA-binding protein
MDEEKRLKLEQAGWRVGSTEEFLELSPEEANYIELKLALASSLREMRTSKNLTQAELATLLKSSQSRVAKMEAGDPTVSLDLLVRSLLSLGLTWETLAGLIAA